MYAMQECRNAALRMVMYGHILIPACKHVMTPDRRTDKSFPSVSGELDCSE